MKMHLEVEVITLVRGIDGVFSAPGTTAWHDGLPSTFNPDNDHDDTSRRIAQCERILPYTKFYSGESTDTARRELYMDIHYVRNNGHTLTRLVEAGSLF